jgi:hypothetical protein
MKAKWFLRIAAVLIFIHLLGHSMGHAGWDKPKDPRMQEVVNAMKSYEGQFMGASQSMADYFNGYSLILFLVLVMSAAQLWIASGVIDSNREITKKLLYPLAVAYFGFSIVEFVYFFPFAAGISFLAGLSTLLAVLSKR